MDLLRVEAATPGLGYAAATSTPAGSSNRRSSQGKDDDSGASPAAQLFMPHSTRCPGDDGLWLMDLQTGHSRLLVSYAELLQSIVQDGR